MGFSASSFQLDEGPVFADSPTAVRRRAILPSARPACGFSLATFFAK
jgi:hypothetical protein